MKFPAAVLVAGLVCCCCAAKARAELATGIRAIVSDAVITDYQVRASAGQAIDLLRRQYAAKPEEFQKKAVETFDNALEQLVERQLIVRDFKTAGYNLPETFVDEAVQDRIRRDYGDRMTLIKTLQAEGMTLEKFRQQIREQIIIGALREKNIASELIVSPHKIESYYNEHRDEFKLEDQVKLRMIVLDSSASATAEGRKKLAEGILSKIKEGATFSEMASVYSTGSQRSQGGDWDWVERPVLRKDLAEVAFALAPKQPSVVVETPEACYLMLVEDKRPAHVRPLSEVRDEVEKTLLIQERARLQKKWIEKLKHKTFVRYF
jgi:peptidyl-prolyl cis-trans isomerase SurA